MAKVTVKAYLDQSYVKKDGRCRFYIQLTLNRKVKRVPLNLFIQPEYYNSKTKRIRDVKDVSDVKEKNLFLQEKENEFEQIILDLERKGQAISFSNILNLYESSLVNDSFIAFARKRIEEERSVVKASSTESLETGLLQLEKYQPKVTIYEIDEDWLEKYRNHMITKLNFKQNTVYNYMAMVRKFLTYAHKKGIIKTNPFNNFSISKEEVPKDFLTLDELEKLHKFYQREELLKMTKSAPGGRTFLIGAKHQETLQHILISCYSGLRHSDITNLRYKHIQNDMIIMPMGKSRLHKQKILRIPITDKLRSVLDLSEDKQPDDFVYAGYVRSRSDINPIVRKIMEKAGIKKYMTFHCTRHTFAVCALTLGMSIETVSDIMGHSDLKTTQIYAKVIDDKRIDEMSKWNPAESEATQTNEPPEDQSYKYQMQNSTNNDTSSSYSADDNIHVVCPNCENIVMGFERGVIKMNKLLMECQFCSSKFSYKIDL